MMSERKAKNNLSPEHERKFNQMPSTSAHASTRITIEQKVSNAKKGPLSTKCSVDPKGLIITRRFGEGSKPLFSRDDILINRNRKSNTTSYKRRTRESSSLDSNEEYNITTVNSGLQKLLSFKERETQDKIFPYFLDPKREADRLREYERRKTTSRIDQNSESNTTPTKRSQRKCSSSDSSEEHYKTTINRHKEKSHSHKGRKTPDKIPYFIDAKREENRLRAKYEHSHESYKTRRRSRTRSRSPRRIKSRRRRRSRPRYRSRSRSHSRRRHRSYDRSRRRNRYRRSSSRDISRHRSPYPEQRYMPAAVPMEYPYTPRWIPPPVHGYHQNPYMLRPPIPFYPLRPPFAPILPKRFP